MSLTASALLARDTLGKVLRMPPRALPRAVFDVFVTVVEFNRFSAPVLTVYRYLKVDIL